MHNYLNYRFYEWKKVGSKKQPYYIHFKDHRPLVFAALYNSWRNSEDRMPVILGNMSSIDAWINCPSSNLGNVLKPYEDSDLINTPIREIRSHNLNNRGLFFNNAVLDKSAPSLKGRLPPLLDGRYGKTIIVLLCRFIQSTPIVGLLEIQLKPAEPEPILKFFTRKGPHDEFQFNISSDKSGYEDIKEDLKKPRIEENNSLLTELQLQDWSHQVEAIPIVKKESEVHGIKSAHDGIKEELDEPKMKEKNEPLIELELVDDSDQIEATPLAKKEVDIHGVKREHEQFEVNDDVKEMWVQRAFRRLEISRLANTV
ncbi:hypothetical protein QJS10_CPA07g00717 [Acorus calamus]|uniref:Uncharacterized protein n=1 Tax=Acorus calamus TaxID=4465 RepID=A0AAV9EFQ9_ACOCL|nr:hypothetical protein QJS10_CPA07g00717 [Acorus calamus]